MRILCAFLLLSLAVPAAAQEQEIRDANLPRQLEWELLRMYEGEARRLDGETVIGRSEVVRGDVAALGGPLRVAGRIEGDVAMVDGDVVVEDGGSITGDVTVVGGQVITEGDARVGGTITAYASTSRSRHGHAGHHDEDEDDDWWWDRRRRDWDRDRGYSRLTLRTGASYNRVEGLPVMFGPVLRTSRPNPLRVEALAIWRTESSSLDTDRMGYQVRVQQFLGTGDDYSLGASAYSVVDPMERWQISDLEASLAAALFHDDYRDHFDRTGWSVFAEARPVEWARAELRYRQEDHTSVAAGDPWSLFHGDDVWRPQPLVAEGELRSVQATLELDGRNDADDPVHGWYARASIERPVGGQLTRPDLSLLLPYTDRSAGTFDPAPSGFPAAAVDMDFTHGLLDVRRYTPVGWESQLNIRLVAGGSLTDRALPAQFQHALGGLGTLPGFDTFLADCGMRSLVGSVDGQRFFPAYGCDRFALGQVEYRGDLSLDFGFGDPDYDDGDWWDEVRIDMSPTWVVFFDAARGWALSDPVFGPARDTGTLYDVGVGFLIDELGFYAALPLNGDVEQEPRFFIRLGRRF